MPLRNLSRPSQVTAWLEEWGGQLEEPAEMILIGSAGILYHAAMAGETILFPRTAWMLIPLPIVRRSQSLLTTQ